MDDVHARPTDTARNSLSLTSSRMATERSRGASLEEGPVGRRKAAVCLAVLPLVTAQGRRAPCGWARIGHGMWESDL